MHILDYLFFWPLMVLKRVPWFRDRRMEDQFMISFVIAVLIYSGIILTMAFRLSA